MLGASGDGRGQDLRDRQVPVVGGVMLREHRDDRAAGLRPRTHVDGRRVQVARRSTFRGRTHIEAQGEHQRRIRAGVVTPTDSNLNFVQLEPNATLDPLDVCC